MRDEVWGGLRSPQLSPDHDPGRYRLSTWVFTATRTPKPIRCSVFQVPVSDSKDIGIVDPAHQQYVALGKTHDALESEWTDDMDNDI